MLAFIWLEESADRMMLSSLSRARPLDLGVETMSKSLLYVSEVLLLVQLEDRWRHGDEPVGRIGCEASQEVGLVRTRLGRDNSCLLQESLPLGFMSLTAAE
mgnify:FL=1